jgi:hypothetical protein
MRLVFSVGPYLGAAASPVLTWTAESSIVKFLAFRGSRLGLEPACQQSVVSVTERNPHSDCRYGVAYLLSSATARWTPWCSLPASTISFRCVLGDLLSAKAVGELSHPANRHALRCAGKVPLSKDSLKAG